MKTRILGIILLLAVCGITRYYTAFFGNNIFPVTTAELACNLLALVAFMAAWTIITRNRP